MPWATWAYLQLALSRPSANVFLTGSLAVLLPAGLCSKRSGRLPNRNPGEIIPLPGPPRRHSAIPSSRRTRTSETAPTGTKGSEVESDRGSGPRGTPRSLQNRRPRQAIGTSETPEPNDTYRFELARIRARIAGEFDGLRRAGEAQIENDYAVKLSA